MFAVDDCGLEWSVTPCLRLPVLASHAYYSIFLSRAENSAEKDSYFICFKFLSYGLETASKSDLYIVIKRDLNSHPI